MEDWAEAWITAWITEIDRDTEVIEHDLALLARLLALSLANQGLESSAAQARKIQEFYENRIDS